MTLPLVLIVEDYAPSRYALRRILGTGRYRFIDAGSLGTARELLRSHRPALALFDVNLPDGNGFDLCCEALVARPGLPIVLMSSSYRSSEHRDAWQSAGAAAFLEHPIDATELRTIAARLLAGANGQPDADG